MYIAIYMFKTRSCNLCKTYEDRISKLESDISHAKREAFDAIAQVELIRKKILQRFQQRKEDKTESNILPNPFNPANGQL